MSLEYKREHSPCFLWSALPFSITTGFREDFDSGFDVKYKTNFFASFDGRMSANSSLIGCCNLCGSEGEGRRKASWPASPDWTEDRVKGSYGLDAKDFVIAFHHRIPTGKVGEFPS